MSREAERKKLQRQGYAHWQILVHPPSLTAAMLAEGLVTDAQLDDADALREAAGHFLMRHCSVGRILKDNATQRTKAAKARASKAKRQDKPKHGSVKRYTPEEIEAWESGKARRNSLWNHRPTYQGYLAGDEFLVRPDNDAWPGRLDEFPPDWNERGRGFTGDRDGRNRSRITGGSGRKESRAKKIKQLDDAQLKKREGRYADKLKADDTSPHFVKTSAKELRSMHGLDSTRGEGE